MDCHHVQGGHELWHPSYAGVGARITDKRRVLVSLANKTTPCYGFCLESALYIMVSESDS